MKTTNPRILTIGYVQRRLLGRFAGGFKPRDTQFAAFQFMALAALRLECLSGGDAGALATARPAYVPLDIVATVGDGIPVVVAFGIPGDRKHLPEAANLDAFDDVDSRHNISPASRIFSGQQGRQHTV